MTVVEIGRVLKVVRYKVISIDILSRENNKAMTQIFSFMREFCINDEEFLYFMSDVRKKCD